MPSLSFAVVSKLGAQPRSSTTPPVAHPGIRPFNGRKRVLLVLAAPRCIVLVLVELYSLGSCLLAANKPANNWPMALPVICPICTRSGASNPARFPRWVLAHKPFFIPASERPADKLRTGFPDDVVVLWCRVHRGVVEPTNARSTASSAGWGAED